MWIRVGGVKSGRLINFIVLPLGSAMVIDPMDLMCNHHLTPTRGGMETVNRNLNGAGLLVQNRVLHQKTGQSVIFGAKPAKVFPIELAQLPGLPQMSQALAKILEKVFRCHTTSQGHVARPSICELCFAAEPTCLRSVAVVDVLCQISIVAYLVDFVFLRLKPVDVILFVLEDALEELPRGIVPRLNTQLDARTEHGQGAHLERQVIVDLLPHRAAYEDRVVVREIGDTFEKENTLDQFVSMLHLFNRFLVVHLLQDRITPVLAHTGMNKILIDAGKLFPKKLVEQVDDSRVSLHTTLLSLDQA